MLKSHISSIEVLQLLIVTKSPNARQSFGKTGDIYLMEKDKNT